MDSVNTSIDINIPTTSTIGDYGYWEPTSAWPVGLGPYVTFGYWPPVEPTDCIGKAHVFECAHESKCKCGSVTRVMPRAKRSK